MTEFLEREATCRERRRISDVLDLPVPEVVGRLLDDDVSILEDHGCPLPSTPEEDHLLPHHSRDMPEGYYTYHSQIRCTTGKFPEYYLSDELVAGIINTEEDLDTDVDMSMASRAAEQAEQLVRKVWEASWKVTHFHSLPKWLQDNDFLVKGHRPPLPSFYACFKSIFRIHTETGNIWTHLLGCVAFIGVAAYFLTRPHMEIQWQEKAVFATFFAGAILCLGLSFTFHTVHCHSERVGKLFSKLDYCGIALLIIGSFVPWLYYGFYCDFQPKLIYLIVVLVLGMAAIIVSLWDKFSEPKFRSLRAGVFMGFGLSGVIPAIHYLIAEGFFKAVYHASLGWLVLMGALYILGAMFYALRVPERFFPGKCDIWFQSHQIFHVLVIAAALVHYHGISEMAMYRLTTGDCLEANGEEIIY